MLIVSSRRSTRTTALAIGSVAALAGSALAQLPEPVVQRVYQINYNPILENQQNKRLHVWANWFDPNSITPQYISDLQQASGGLLTQAVTFRIDADEFPIKVDGFRYTDASYTGQWGVNNWHQPDAVDYGAIVRDYDLARRVDLGQIDEVFVHGAPYFGYYESRMVGDGAYWCNSPPLRAVASQRLFVMMGFNYERGIAEMLHSNSHRSESIVSRTYGTWNLQNPQTMWDRFTQNIGQTAPRAAVGSCHYPANGTADYDYGNTQTVDSTAIDWLNNFPNLTGQTSPVNRETWGGPDYHRNYMKWWYTHLPKRAGTNFADEYFRLNNWWQYLKNMNAWSESGGKFVQGFYPVPSQPAARAARPITATAGDEWFPQVNNAGRTVWSGFDGVTHHIYSADWTGANVVKLSPSTPGWLHEMPRINENGRVVWQAFNGRNWHIFSSNADGTGLVQLTSGNLDRKHPAINNNASAPGGGSIVYQAFDGTQWQIRAVNADGTNDSALTTSTTPSGQIPRDNVWPQINTPVSGQPRVVWMGHDGTSWEIFSANLDGTGLTNISNVGTRLDEYPRINNSGRIVWQGWVTDTNCNVYAANADGSAQRTVAGASYSEYWPRINSIGRVVYMGKPDASKGWQIFSASSTSGSPIQITPTDYTQHGYPVLDDTSVAGGRIIWQSFDGVSYHIYQRVSSVTTKLSSGSADHRAPMVSSNGQFVAWHADSGPGGPGGLGNSEAWTTSTRPPCPADLTGDFFVDDADFVLFAAAYESFTCSTLCPADFSADGFVDDTDFVTFAQAYETFTCP